MMVVNETLKVTMMDGSSNGDDGDGSNSSSLPQPRVV
jgi:hypothetical protein